MEAMQSDSDRKRNITNVSNQKLIQADAKQSGDAAPACLLSDGEPDLDLWPLTSRCGAYRCNRRSPHNPCELRFSGAARQVIRSIEQ